MKSRAAFVYIGLAIVLLIPYLFYAVLFRGVFGYMGFSLLGCVRRGEPTHYADDTLRTLQARIR